MSDSDSDFPFPFAFGEGAGEEFKERLKELMRAQREAFEEVQAESGGQLAAVDRWQVIQQAVMLASAAMRALEPRADARRGGRRDGAALRPLHGRAAGGAPPQPVGATLRPQRGRRASHPACCGRAVRRVGPPADAGSSPSRRSPGRSSRRVAGTVSDEAAAARRPRRPAPAIWSWVERQLAPIRSTIRSMSSTSA